MRKGSGLAAATLFLLASFVAQGQTAKIDSAEKVFSDLRDHYKTITDYEAQVTVTQGDIVSTARLSYKAPDQLNMRFDNPSGQVINFDGKKLDYADPVQKVVLEQEYKSIPADQVSAIATGPALAMIQTRYSIAFLVGPDAVAIDTGSKEMVTKLNLVARATTSFSQLLLSIENKTIRRIEATLQNGDRIVLDFTKIAVNVGVPQSRFVFVAPADYEIVRNWLFDPKE